MAKPAIDYLGAAGGVFVRQLHFDRAGDVHQGHKHAVNHVTLVHKGAVRCEVEGLQPLILREGAWITIDKDTHHQFTALEDNTTYFCIFSLYDENGRVNAHPGDKVLGQAQCAGCVIACA